MWPAAPPGNARQPLNGFAFHPPAWRHARARVAPRILSFQGSWNNFSDVLVAHQSPSLDTLTTGIGRLVSGQLGAGTQYPLQLTAAIAMTVPVAVLFFVFQKYIMRTGQGAVKE